jgi:hypothetical protein
MRFSGSKAQIEKYWGQTKKKLLEFPSLKFSIPMPVDRYRRASGFQSGLNTKEKPERNGSHFFPAIYITKLLSLSPMRVPSYPG